MFTLEDLKTRPLSFTSLKEFRKSPQHFIKYRVGIREESKPLRMGALIHFLILEDNDKFDDEYIVYEGASRRNKGYKELLQDCQSKNDFRTIITKDELDVAKSCKLAIHNNSEAIKHLSDIENTEKCIKWEEKGLPFIGYIDGYSPITSNNKIVEIKTGADVSPISFMKSVFNYGYNQQAAFYIKGGIFNTLFDPNNIPEFIWITVEKEAPFAVACYRMTPEVFDHGVRKCSETIDDFIYCMENDLWTSSYDFQNPFGTFDINLPAWIK